MCTSWRPPEAYICDADRAFDKAHRPELGRFLAQLDVAAVAAESLGLCEISITLRYLHADVVECLIAKATEDCCEI